MSFERRLWMNFDGHHIVRDVAERGRASRGEGGGGKLQGMVIGASFSDFEEECMRWRERTAGAEKGGRDGKGKGDHVTREVMDKGLGGEEEKFGNRSGWVLGLVFGNLRKIPFLQGGKGKGGGWVSRTMECTGHEGRHLTGGNLIGQLKKKG